MRIRVQRLLPVACWALLGFSFSAIGDDDDKTAESSRQAMKPSLNGEQQLAVGIVMAHPLAATAPERILALGLVLDTTTLVADMGESNAAAIAEHSASAEVARLQALYEGGAGASLKMLEAAEADRAKAKAAAEIAAARFALHWSPLAELPAGERQKVVQASISGRSLLLRADLPGRHIMGANPSKAVLDVDGVQVPGRVLGTLRQTSELQSVGLLIEVQSAPAGLGPGARVPVSLLTAERKGVLLPRNALIYDENGAYVYKQLAGKTDARERARYALVKVHLLVPYGDGWLVEGVDDDDNIVVHGAGALWSMQGVRAQAVDGDDD